MGGYFDFQGSKRHISLIYWRIWIAFVALSSVRIGLTRHHVEFDVSDNTGNYIFPAARVTIFWAQIPENRCVLRLRLSWFVYGTIVARYFTLPIGRIGISWWILAPFISGTASSSLVKHCQIARLGRGKFREFLENIRSLILSARGRQRENFAVLYLGTYGG
jgi:hypothetical protein